MSKSETPHSAPNIPKIVCLGVLATVAGVVVLNRPASMQDFRSMIAYRQPSTEIDNPPNETSGAGTTSIASTAKSSVRKAKPVVVESPKTNLPESMPIEKRKQQSEENPLSEKTLSGKPRHETRESTTKDWPSTSLKNKRVKTEKKTSDSNKIEALVESPAAKEQSISKSPSEAQGKTTLEIEDNNGSNTDTDINTDKQLLPRKPISNSFFDLPLKTVEAIVPERSAEPIPAPVTTDSIKPQLPKPQNAPSPTPTQADAHVVHKPVIDAHTQSLFAESCADCHGSSGSGRQTVGDFPSMPDFTSAGWQEKRSAARIRAAITYGAGTDMPPFEATISEDDTSKLVQLIRSFGLKSDSSTDSSSVASTYSSEDIADGNQPDNTPVDDRALDEFKLKRAELLDAWNQLTAQSNDLAQ